MILSVNRELYDSDDNDVYGTPNDDNNYIDNCYQIKMGIFPLLTMIKTLMIIMIILIVIILIY